MNRLKTRCVLQVLNKNEVHCMCLKAGIAFQSIVKPEAQGNICTRNVTTHSKSVHKDEGLVQRAVQGFKLYIEKHKLKAAGCRLYESVADKIDYPRFMMGLNMPDTFHSWFLITELHLWMLMVKLMSDPARGRVARNSLVEALWQDVNSRVSQLGPEASYVAKTQLPQLSEQFQAALVSYDEGLLSDDYVLAGAVWRRLLNRDSSSPENVELMVKYIRKSVCILDRVDPVEFIFSKKSRWIPAEEVFKESK